MHLRRPSSNKVYIFLLLLLVLALFYSFSNSDIGSNKTGFSPVAPPEVVFNHEKYGFSVEVPSEFTLSRDPVDKVGALLTLKGSHYPTFNVLVQPGTFRADSADLKKERSELERQYGLVGLTNIKVKKVTRGNINGKSSVEFEISYDSPGGPLSSHVSKVTGSGRHFILTYIDQTPEYPGRRFWLERLKSSFLIDGDPFAGNTGTSFSKLRLLSLSASIPVVGLLLCWQYYRLFRAKSA